MLVTTRGPLQSKKPSREKRKEATDNVRSFLWVIQKKNTLSKIIIITTHHASPWGLVRRDQKGIWSLGGPTVTFLKILKNWVWRGQDLVTELQDGTKGIPGLGVNACYWILIFKFCVQLPLPVHQWQYDCNWYWKNQHSTVSHLRPDIHNPNAHTHVAHAHILPLSFREKRKNLVSVSLSVIIWCSSFFGESLFNIWSEQW